MRSTRLILLLGFFFAYSAEAGPLGPDPTSTSTSRCVSQNLVLKFARRKAPRIGALPPDQLQLWHGGTVPLESVNETQLVDQLLQRQELSEKTLTAVTSDSPGPRYNGITPHLWIETSPDQPSGSRVRVGLILRSFIQRDPNTHQDVLHVTRMEIADPELKEATLRWIEIHLPQQAESLIPQGMR